MTKSLVIGHRGASTVAPENTLAALAEAVRLGADGVEFDVRMTADGVPVLLHDATVDRTTDGKGDIEMLTWRDVEQLDAGSWRGSQFAGERVPSLEVAVEWMKEQPILSLLLEVKGRVGQYPGLVEQLYMTLLQAPDLAARTTVISFDPWWIGRLRELLPTAQTGVIYGKRPADPIAAAGGPRANALAAAHYTLSADDVSRAHEAGLEVYAWTLDTREQLESMMALGVDGLVTNDVALARRIVDES